MVAPVRGRGRGQKNGMDKGRGRGMPRRPFIANGPPPFPNPPMIPPMMGPFPPRGRPMPPPPMMRGMPRRGGPPRMMGPGPRGPPPIMHPPLRPPPPPGMRPPPPPHMMNRPPIPPPMVFRGTSGRGRNSFRGVQKGRVMKKRKTNPKPMDLTKPWVTEAIKSEFNKKDELLNKAKATSKQDDWTAYTEQRDKCTKVFHAAEMEFIGQQEGCEDLCNPYEGYDEEMDYEEEDISIQNTNLNEQDDIYDETVNPELFFLDNSENPLYLCDACNRDFPTQQLFEKHMSEHKVCRIDGCTFTAHEKIIEAHIMHQHSTGLYDRIRNCNTPEDISKWVEERKRNHPCGRTIDDKIKEQEELLERGVKIGERNNKFGKDKTRLARTEPRNRCQNRKKNFRKNNEKTNRSVKKYLPKTLIDDKADWNGNMFPFKGTYELFNEEESGISDFEDEEWEDKSSHTKDFGKVNASLGALIGAYGSTDEEEEESKVFSNSHQDNKVLEKDEIIVEQKNQDYSEMEPKVNDAENVIEVDGTASLGTELDKHIENKIESDDEAPLEIKIERHTENKIEASVTTAFECKIDNAESTLQKQVNNADNSDTSKRKRKRKTHDKKNNDINVNNDQHKSRKSDFPYQNFKKRRITLLEKLLDKEIRHERNILLQCVKYVVENEFFINESSNCK
ncbi:hypothetical protein WA026_000625 [Henosepilachna vigintioctopunctata]|uniref:C2H2-type domain-containing protein n=1 Tax=Henosepilachna vigintioctopunctata TaxID=420089 RepID=A0AAW1V4R8_9CUCU